LSAISIVQIQNKTPPDRVNPSGLARASSRGLLRIDPELFKRPFDRVTVLSDVEGSRNQCGSAHLPVLN